MSTFVTNDIKRTKSLSMTFTADNDAATAAMNDVPVINGAGKGYGGLPAGVTMTGANGMTYDQLQDSFQKNPIRIRVITLYSASADDIYPETMKHGKILFDGKEGSKTEEIFLDGYATQSNGSYDPNLKIRDKSILVSPKDFLTVPVKKNASTRVILEWDYEQDGVAVATAIVPNV